MGMVIVGYRPKPGCEVALLALVRGHVPTLRGLGLASDRPTLAMRSTEGVILEVFEWREGAMAAAHRHPDVLAMWERFGAVCDHVRLSELPETQELFATFAPLDL